MNSIIRTSQRFLILPFAAILSVAALLPTQTSLAQSLDVSAQWEAEVTSDGTVATARHEAAGVVIGDDIYLIGGRGNRPMERYSTTLKQWENLGVAPRELHHFQPVAFDNKIFAIGAFTCCYPREELVPEVYRYDPSTSQWDIVGNMPTGRVRGSAAAFVYANKIYILGGNTEGHDGGAVAWFDEYDPVTGDWQELPDAPHARDHFAAALVGPKVIAAAGRQTTLPNPSDNTVVATDIYDFSTGLWHTTADIPTARGGVVSVSHGDSVIVLGGEINTSSDALDSVEAFDVSTETWSSLPSMITGRHGSGGGVVSGVLHMISGASSLGGATEVSSHEILQLPELNTTTAGCDCENPDSGEEPATDTGGSETTGGDTEEGTTEVENTFEESCNSSNINSSSDCSTGGGRLAADTLLFILIFATARWIGLRREAIKHQVA